MSGLQVVDLADRPLEQARHEVLAAAVQVGDVRDRERSCCSDGADMPRVVGRPGRALPCVVRRKCLISRHIAGDPPRFANEAELECAKILDFYGVPWDYEPRTFVLEQDEDGPRRRGVHARLLPPRAGPLHRDDGDEAVARDPQEPQAPQAARQYPEVKVKLFYKRDIERLAQRYGSKLAS